MITGERLLRARGHASLGVACVVTALAAVSPAGAVAAGAKSEKLLGVSIPASARIHGTTTSSATPPVTTQAQATTTQAQATTTPAPSTPEGGAQPGTVAPSGGTPTTTAPPATTTPSATPTTTAPAAGSTTVVGAARKTSPSNTHLSAGALALAVLGALLILGCLVWVVGRWLVLEPRWTVSFMHSLREASYRASATWAEFSDWARIGH